MSAPGAGQSFVETTRTDIKLPPPPRRRRELGLRPQLLVGLALVSLLAVGSIGLLSLWAATANLREQREQTALTLVTAAAAACASALPPGAELGSPGGAAALGPVLRRLTEKSGLSSLSVVDVNGQVVAAQPTRPASDQDLPVMLSALSGVPPVLSYRDSPVDGEIELVSYAPLVLHGQAAGAVRVTMSAAPPIIALIARAGWLLLGLALAEAILLVTLGYLLLTQLVVRPLRVIEQATTAVTAGQLEQAITPSGPRELVALAEAFNQMTASLASQREQLIRTEKLASVGQLAAGVAHEIGNPLAAILGFAELLKGDAAEPAKHALSDDERRDITARVKAETQRIHRIISDLLEYSRPGREEARATDLVELVRSAAALLAPQARFREIQVALEPGEGGSAESPGWPVALASPVRLKQVFVNLLLNAADAMNGSGTIRVSCAAAGDRVRVLFADQGPGVGRGDRRKIFDPFFTTKEPGKGTGLGLSISRAIVETHGGTLELLATPEGETGARFAVSLPAVAGTLT